MALVRMKSTRDFFRIMYGWRKHSIAAFLIFVGLIMGFAYIYTPDYEVTAKVMILPRTNDELVTTANDSKGLVLPVSVQDVNTEIELLKSGQVIRETVRSLAEDSKGKRAMGLKVQKASWVDRMVDKAKYYFNEACIYLKLKPRLPAFEANVALLSDSLEVEPVAASNVILLTLTAEAPKVGTNVMNRLLDIYVNHHNRSFTKEGEVAFLDNQRNSSYSNLVKAEDEVREYQQKSGLVDVKKQIEANIALLSEFANDRKRNELAIGSQENRIALLKQSLESNKRDIVISKEMRTVPAVVDLERGITPLLVSRSELLKTHSPSSREIKDMDVQIESLRGEVRKELIQALKTDEMELVTLKVQRDLLNSQISKLSEETRVMNQREHRLKNMEREAKIREENYKLYSIKREEARIYREQKNQDLVNVKITDRPVIPVKPSFPNRFLMLIVSIFVGFFIATGTPFLLEYLDHRVKTSADAEEMLSLPVICSFVEEKS